MKGPCETRIMTAVKARLDLLEQAGQPIMGWRQNVGSAVDRRGQTFTFGEKGQSDLMYVVRGRFVAIETKSESGRQSIAQKAWQGRVEDAGGLYFLADTIDEAIAPVLELLELTGRATWSKDHWEIA